MIAIGGMPVPVVGVIDVLVVRYGLVAATRAVYVCVTGMSQMRERMLVIVAIMRRVGVSFVHVVDVSFALRARVPAAWPVYVVVVVNVMLGGCHASSLL
jgi:hypothetical protein